MDPSSYSGLTGWGPLGLGVLFFGSVSVVLFRMLISSYREFAAQLLKLNMDQIIAQNAQTRAHESLSKAIESNTDTLKNLQRK